MAAPTSGGGHGGARRDVWTLTAADSDGDPVSHPGAADRTVQVTGTFDAGTVTLQGSNESPPTNWATLHSPVGDDLAFTSAGIAAVLENPLFIRPVIAGEGETADVEVTLVSRSG